MSTALEIEQAIETLPAAEYSKLLAWLDQRRGSQVDASFEDAVLSGKFDAMARQADLEIAAGDSMPLDEFLRQH